MMKKKFNSSILTKIMYEKKLKEYEKDHDIYYSLASVFPNMKDDDFELKLLGKIKFYEKLISKIEKRGK